MKEEITLEGLKKIQQDILDVVDEYCKCHKLRYYLAYGTLLGAVRHKGYIPWDDDIDIVMPRPDYEYFLSHFSSSDERYKVMKFRAYAKAYDNKTVLTEDVTFNINIGVNIDIFPLDGLSANKTRNIKLLNESTKLNFIYDRKIWKMNQMPTFYRKLKLFVFKLFTCCLSLDSINKKLFKMCKEVDYTNAVYVANIVAPYGPQEILDKKVFDTTISLEFEGKKYFAPGKYDEYLTSIFGDYMQLPPVEKRVTHHSFKAYKL